MTLADTSAGADGVVTPRADRSKRRRFTAAYRAAILSEYEAADRSERGVILRREGLYSSHELAALTGVKKACALLGRPRALGR